VACVFAGRFTIGCKGHEWNSLLTALGGAVGAALVTSRRARARFAPRLSGDALARHSAEKLRALGNAHARLSTFQGAFRDACGTTTRFPGPGPHRVPAARGTLGKVEQRIAELEKARRALTAACWSTSIHGSLTGGTGDETARLGNAWHARERGRWGEINCAGWGTAAC